MNKMNYADLFCGCGGFSYGFYKNRNFKNIISIDNWEKSIDVYKKNYSKSNAQTADLSDPTVIKSVTKLLIENNCDILIGGPPCQGFSTLGLRRNSDKRSKLVDEFIKIGNKVQPKIIIMENVRGILSMKHPDGGLYPDKVRSLLSVGGKNKWHCEDYLIDMATLGLAQTRKRNLFIAINKEKVDVANFIKFFNLSLTNEVKKNKNLTLKDIIFDLPRIEAGQSSDFIKSGNLELKLLNHVAMNHSESLVQRFKFVPPGGGLPDVPRELLNNHLLKMVEGKYGSGGHVKNIYGRLEWDKPAGTIVAGIDKITCGRFVHPENHRLLTPRECARIQSFPDNFEFIGSHVAQYYMIGNAVPPKFSQFMAKTLARLLK